MKIIEDNTAFFSLSGMLIPYAINEHAQEIHSGEKGLPLLAQWDPYQHLPPEVSDFMINYASTFSGSYVQCFIPLYATGIAFTDAKEKTKLTASFLSVAAIGGLNLYNEVKSIPGNTTHKIDTGDSTAIALGLSCFIAVVFNHMRKNRNIRKQQHILN